ncbi:dead deah box helicase domain-containing protein, partial [Cystoisospora suis]
VLSSTGAGGKHHKAGGAAAQKKDKKAAKNEKGKKKDATKEGKENDEKKEGCLGEEESEESKALNIHRVSRAAVYDFRVKNGSEAHVQLRFMGGDFERTTGSRAKKDPRVLFTPDYWQVHLLDLIDRYESAFVTAPTSSGKTFICFYAMELVLRLSNCATIVYVSPSKALAD